MIAPIKLLITDLDNTLYDWVTYFARSFAAMTRSLSELLRVDEAVLLDEFKAIHQRYGNSEQPYAAFELPSVHLRFGSLTSSEQKRMLDPALHAFNSARKRHLKLYEGVSETLEALVNRGIRIVGHTEAIAVNAYYRLDRLAIAGHFRRLYALEGHLEPHPDRAREHALQPPNGLIVEVPRVDRKPNPRLLRDICAEEGVSPAEAWYVGDSLIRDMAMAQSAGVTAIWARYGTHFDAKDWQTLIRVTHWTNEDVVRESELRLRFRETVPDFQIDRFDEIIRLVDQAERGVPRRRLRLAPAS